MYNSCKYSYLNSYNQRKAALIDLSVHGTTMFVECEALPPHARILLEGHRVPRPRANTQRA